MGEDGSAKRNSQHERDLAYYILFRLLISLGLLSWSIWALYDNPEELLAVRPQFYLAATAFFFMGASAGLAPKYAKEPTFVWLQIIVDAIFVSALLAADGIQSPLFILYSLNIVGSVRIISPTGVLIVAFLDTCIFLLVVWYIQSYGGNKALPEMNLYSQLAFRVFGLLLIGVLASSLAQRQVETQRTLAAQVRQTERLSLQHRNLLKQLPIAMFLVDDGVISFQNQTSLRFFGDVKSQKLDALMTVSSDHWEFPHKRGEESWLLDVRCIDIDEQRQVLLFEDVASMREMEARSLKEMRLAAVGRLAASLAHEIRNPLASLSGAAQLLAETQSSRLHQIILREVKRLNGLVEDFLRSAKPPSLQRKFINPNKIVEQVIESFRLDPRSGHLSIELNLFSSEDEVFLDEEHFSQVLWNLIINASQATTEGDKLVIDSRNEDKKWVLSLSDTGAGIEDELIGKIFDPFFTMRSGGTGLGLATVERIIHGHGGRIRVESTLGEGTSFVIEIPILRS